MANHPIGTKFKTRGKHSHVCTVTDIHKTYNVAGELVKTVYVATHEFCGQQLIERDICRTTISMGLTDSA